MTAPARRPQVVLFDLFETCLQLEGLRPRFAALGRPEDELGCSSPASCTRAWR